MFLRHFEHDPISSYVFHAHYPVVQSKVRIFFHAKFLVQKVSFWPYFTQFSGSFIQAVFFSGICNLLLLKIKVFIVSHLGYKAYKDV